MTDREKLVELINQVCEYSPVDFMHPYGAEIIADHLIANGVTVQQPVTGETSDGYHTFNELYHHRAVLFSVIVKAFPDKAWKSRRHSDGSMFDGMFIVGIETPSGQATYHYDVDPYWDMFSCKEVEFAPEWDGHTPAQAIERIGKLEPLLRLPVLHGDTLPTTRKQALERLGLKSTDEVLEESADK